MATIKQDDFIQSVADALQYISFYHPVDYITNLARAYELAGRKRQAVVALETFLSREPSSGEKDQINRRIEVLKKKIAEEDAAAAAAPPPTTGTTQQPATPTTNETAPIADDNRARRSPWPWVLMGVGAVGTTVGTIGYLSAKNKSDEIAQQCTPPGDRDHCMPEIAKQGTEQNKKMTTNSVIAGVGVAAIVGGAIWWFLDKRHVDSANQGQASNRKPLVLPLVSTQMAGVGVLGAF